MEEFKPSRRDVVAASAVAATLAAAGAPLPNLAAEKPEHKPAMEVVKGFVFDVTATAGSEKKTGLAGVLVSNGRDVVRTGQDGSYRLPITAGMAVFVIKPVGYSVPIDKATSLPRFSYIHQPEGTPKELDLLYLGLPPTGPLPDSVDFGLIKRDEPKSFDVVLLTDPQPESDAEIDFIREDVVNSLIGAKAAFGITAGDLMFDDLSLYGRYNGIIAQTGLPWWNIGGNHDLNFEAPDARYSRETFKRVFGANYYAFEFGDALFIMLDNVDYLGADPNKPRRNGKYQGRIGERQLAFVANVLRQTPADRLIVLVMHIPLRTYLDPTDPSVNTIDAAALLALLGDRPAISFAGHTHTTEHHYLGRADGAAGDASHHHHVLTAVSGSWWSGPFDRRGVATADSRDGTPNGFHILSVDGARYETRFAPAKEAGGRQMRICLDSEFHRGKDLYLDYRVGQLLGSPLRREQVGSTTLIVNFFDGGPRTKVEYQIGDGGVLPMKQDVRPDPFVEEVYGRNQATIKPWVKAEPSSHIWIARLPADLAPGAHSINVHVVDEYGRDHNGHMVIEVTG